MSHGAGAVPGPGGDAELRGLLRGDNGGDAGAPCRAAWDVAGWAILLVGMVIRFIALGRQSFWYDEMRAVSSVWGSHADTLSQTALGVRTPLYHLLLRAWIPLVGSGETQVRLLSAILGALGLVLFHRIMPRFLGRASAVIALALVALSPFNLWYSQEATSYALFFDAGLLAVPALLIELERRTRWSFVIALLAAAATCLANPSGFFLFPLGGVYVLTAGRRIHYPVTRFIMFALLSAVLLWPWFLRGAGTTGPLHLGRPEASSDVPVAKGDAPPGLASIPFAFYAFSLGHSVGPNLDELKQYRMAAVMPHLWFLVPAGLLFAFVAYQGVRRASRALQWVLLPWVAVPVLMMAAAAMFNLKAPNPRYAYLAFVPYMAYLAIGVTSLRNNALKGLVGAALLSCVVFSDYGYFTNPRCWKPDARSAGQLLTREVGPDDAVVCYTLQDPVRYYVPDTMVLLQPAQKDFADRSTVTKWLEANTKGKRRVWVVQYHGWWADPENHFVRACRETMTLDQEWPFPRVPVDLFVKAKAPGTGTIAPPDTARTLRAPTARARRRPTMSPGFAS